MKIATIDIGTNAIKLKLYQTTSSSITPIESVRSPIRLGSDAFLTHTLSTATIKILINELLYYQSIIKDHKVVLYDIVATSAFRNLHNAEEIRIQIEYDIEHPFRIISGLEEARLLQYHEKAENNDALLFVDVGGGSTEIYQPHSSQPLYKSFGLGAVRNSLHCDKESEWKKLEQWLTRINSATTLIGVGGSLKAMLKSYQQKEMNNTEFLKNLKYLSQLSVEQKLQQFPKLQDRADIIDHALKIYEFIIKNTHISRIKATKWGISDAIAIKLFHQVYAKSIKVKR